ncbi:MAG: hypothetical protein GY710_20065 [Desulfobacteraceae bacterium]|nr:hypothetical protein [Desulfobacteraceae bacterium]
MRYEYFNEKLVSPRISLILLDWNCRESFHILEYLKNQSIPRNEYEIIWIEYYSGVPEVQKNLLDESLENWGYPAIDQWIVMEMPEDIYYHKHLMYNIGIAFSRGQILLIGDSDAIVNNSLLESVIEEFNKDESIVLHMDQFRNVRHDFHPFNFPSIDDVIGEGCINIENGKTTGVLDFQDPLHTRNYGACMCATREDIISVGGADEHLDYLGHICGPYDLTFRLKNIGRIEVWHQKEFLYHVWHPGQAGEGNYLGPHDGRHMSSTALETLQTGRKKPLVENSAIREIREGRVLSTEEKFDLLINQNYLGEWKIQNLDKTMEYQKAIIHPVIENFKGLNIFSVKGTYYAVKIGELFDRDRFSVYPSSKNLEFIKGLLIKKVNNQDKDVQINLINKIKFYIAKFKRKLRKFV